MAVALRLKSGRPSKQSSSSGVVWQKLDDYQQEAVNAALLRRTLAVLFDQGTGKTFVAGGVIERLMTPSFAALLIVPLSNKETTWRKFLIEHIPSLTLFSDLQAFLKHVGPKLLLLHLDQLGRASGKKLVARLRKHRYSIIILDEAQRIKDRASGWSRNVAKLRYCAVNKLILTGTPMDEQPVDMWAQFRFLRPNVFGTRWKIFEDEFLEPLDDKDQERLSKARPGSFRFQRLMRSIMIRRGKRKFDMSKLPQFLERVSPWCVRITQEELGWDKAIFHRSGVDIRGEQRRVYDDLEQNLIAKLPRATITAPLKVVRLEKMRQVCGGYLIDGEKGVHEVGRAKMRRLKRLVRDNVDRSPVVIFCRYTAEVDAIVEELMPTYVVAKFSGSVKAKDRVTIQEMFQQGLIDVLVCQIKTGGVGIDLFRSHIGIMYSPVYSFIDFDQAIKRLKRRGQLKQVHIFLLFARGTIDEDAFSAIVRKRNIVEHVLMGIKERSLSWQNRKRCMA